MGILHFVQDGSGIQDSAFRILLIKHLMRRVLIFTSIERAFYSPLIEYQLFEPIVGVSKRSRNHFIYVGFIPITFWFSRAEPWQSFILYKRNRKKVKQLLSAQGINCSFIPIIFPIRHKDFYLRIMWLILYVLNALPLLLYFLLRYRINLVHARNYPAGLICFLTRCILGIPYNFDMRDLYPEKGIEAGVFGKLKTQKSKVKSQISWSYKLWKFIELKLMRGALSIITTSAPFKEYVSVKLLTVYGNRLAEIGGGKPKPETRIPIIVIPNCVNTSRFKADEVGKGEARTQYGLTNKFILIHSGAFGTARDIPVVGEYFLKWKRIMRDTQKQAHLVILCGTKEYLPYIRRVIESVGVLKEDWTLINPKFEDVPKLLLLGDVGLHLETMAIATPYCIAVKDGEYLASGLPVIVTPWLKGIATLIKKYNVGIVVTPWSEDAGDEKRLLEKYDDMRKNSFRLVREYLSLENCVEKLLLLYQAISL